MAPEQLDAEISQAEQIRKEIMTAETRLSGLRLKRDQTERALADRLIGLASGVRGHPDYGSDSPFYRALGIVPDSENHSGRPRKPKRIESAGLSFTHGPRDSSRLSFIHPKERVHSERYLPQTFCPPPRFQADRMSA